MRGAIEKELTPVFDQTAKKSLKHDLLTFY